MTKKIKAHGNHENNCKICQLTADEQADIKFLYVNWASVKELATKLRLTEACIRRHATQTGWLEERLSNTKAKWASVADSEVEFKGSDVTKSLENIDKHMGNVEDKDGELLTKLDALTRVQLLQALKDITGK